MKKNTQILVLVVITIAHSYAFLYAWAYFGATAMFSVGAATNSYFQSVLAASLASAITTTLPLALLAGLIGRQLCAFTVLIFTLGWLVFNFYISGWSSIAINSTHYSLPVELLTISIFGFFFYKLGARLVPNYAIKGTSA